MTSRWYALWGCIAALLLLVAVMPPAKAEEACVTVDDLYARAETVGARVAGAAVYDGSMSDMTIIVEEEGGIVLYAVKEGCIVAMLLLDFPAKVKPTA